jgi:MFS family permease
MASTTSGSSVQQASAPSPGRISSRFPALRYRNFRCYAIGQGASIGGTWVQNVALSWLVLKLTGSGAAVGLVTASQFLPPLLFGAWAGAVADRFDARRAVLALQVPLCAQATALTVLVLTHHAALWSLCALASVQGLGSAFDPPVRQSLINELVGDADLANAIATNSALVQLGLILGPTVAAALIPTVGIGWCFAVNAASYVVMFAAIRAIRPGQMIRRPRSQGAAASVRAGFGYLRSRHDIHVLLIVLGLGSLMAFRLEVLLPVLAKQDLHGTAGLFSAMTAIRGAGALLASLYLASHGGPLPARLMRQACLCLAISLALMAVPNTAVVLVALFPAGLGLMTVVICTLSSTQTLASPDFRGRVVAMWFVVMNGGVVLGSLLTGALIEVAGSRTALLSGAASMLAVLAIVHRRSTSISVGDRLVC